jgi:hypothetical protein
VFFQPAALVIDCNGSAVMHQTIDDCGCSVCKWALNRRRVKRHGIAFVAWGVTAAMHGNAPAVAAATALQTLAAIVTVPIWISLAIL